MGQAKARVKRLSGDVDRFWLGARAFWLVDFAAFGVSAAARHGFRAADVAAFGALPGVDLD